jgi:serine/threonine protein phosphatase 1
MERIFAVGDIHGCLDKLMALMDKVQIDPERDLLLFIGDYIDRGEQSKQVVDYLVDLKKRVKSTVFLLGNHEHMFMDYYNGGSIQPFLYNGGQKTLDSYFGANQLKSHKDPKIHFPQDHIEFFNALLPYYVTEEHIFVHAGLRSGIPLEKQDLFDLIWIREEFFYSKFDFGKTVVFGHTPFPQPFILNQKIGIDTGAVYGNKLTCLELPEMRFFSA